MYQVRSITPTRVALTTHHDTQYQAKLEVHYRTERGDHNAMIVDTECRHLDRRYTSFGDGDEKCHGFFCKQCGMITNFGLPSDFASKKYIDFSVFGKDEAEAVAE